MRLVLRVLCLLLLVDVVAPAQELLRMYDPDGRITTTPQKGFCDVPQAIKQEITGFLKTDRMIAVCRMPATVETYLVSAQVESYDTHADYGLRFLLLTHANKQWRLVYHSKGMMDSYILHPIFYTGRDTILIMGETGAEEFWDLEAFEYARESVRFLGRLEVYKKQSMPSGISPDVPLKGATVEAVNGSYNIHLRGPLFRDPTGDGAHEINISGPGSVTTFTCDGNGCRLVRPQGSGAKGK